MTKTTIKIIFNKLYLNKTKLINLHKNNIEKKTIL